MDRKLASVQRIAEIKEIPGADEIEAARVNGWWVVVKHGEFAVGYLVCYIEIDSWVPTEIADFLSRGREPREFNGVKGERLRTIKLRGQLSQGLLLPVTFIQPHKDYGMHFLSIDGKDDAIFLSDDNSIKEGAAPDDYIDLDITEWLGIQKWEKPIPTHLSGVCRSNFPSCIPKTDQERVQNIPDVFLRDGFYQVTVKLDGSSMTVAWIEGEMHVCSRNIDLKLDQEGNTFVDTAKRLFSEPRPLWNIAIQGELMGPGIQGNRENLKEHEFFVFDIFDIGRQQYFPPTKTEEFCETHGLKHVPVVGYGSLESLGMADVDSILEFAEGPSLNHPVREGVVFKEAGPVRFSFKAISNKFLMGEK